jgi:tRNA(Ile)-lysidine synthase
MPTAAPLHPFEQALKSSWSPDDWRDRTVLVAISGGADSVALLRGLHRLRTEGVGKLVVGHFNHALRGQDSDEDAQFVLDLSAQLRLEFRLGRRSSNAAASEEALRDERLRFLQDAAEKLGARYVATAHTADDQAETILHRIVRGTGIAGLAGIRRIRPLGEAAMLLRPTLGISRVEVLAYLDALGQPFREDASNRSLEYTRNRIRHQLFPLLESEYNPKVRNAILRLGQLADDARAISEQSMAAIAERALVQKTDCEVRLDCAHFDRTMAPLIRELFASLWRQQRWPLGDMGYAEWERLTNLSLHHESQTIDLPGPVRAQKKGAQLTLTRL